MTKIVLTCDRTLLSTYNDHVFLGFAACAPKTIPLWLYKRIFCPLVEEDNNQVKYAHCGQRKIEAALIEHGFKEDDIAIVNPDKLDKVVDKDTKVLGVTTHDPLGLGPASTTFSDLMNREPYTAIFFRKMIQNPVIRKYNLKVIVGGAGAWQLTDERIMAKYDIDCVVLGEGEKTGVEIIEKMINDEPYPAVAEGEVVPLDKIPLIRKPTINGLIEICRGCGRGCRFCTPTMRNYRCQPLEYIIKEAKINVDAGNGVLLHAEDVLRYKTKGFTPDEKEVTRLFTEVRKLTDHIGISHIAHASVAANPHLIERLSEIVEVGSKTTPFMSGQVGVETGSPRMIEKYMKGKVKPFQPREWPDVVIKSHQILNDNKWVPANTMIMGLPGEKKEDVNKSIELVQNLSEYKSLIVPLFFVPIGNLKENNRFFRVKHMLPEHWQLLSACIRHSIKFSYILADDYLGSRGMRWWKRTAIKRVIRFIDNRLKPYLKMMDEGVNPMTQM
jgi:radical SAM superfamily enzyme YgiQ (UPF0313 family)